MSEIELSRSGEALREGVEKALGERLDVDYWHQLEAESALANLDTALWLDITDLGLPTLLAAAEAGGSAAALVEAHGALEALAAMSVPAPAAESMLGAWLAGQLGLKAPSGILTLGPVNPHDQLTLTRDTNGWRLQGTARDLPFGRYADGLLVDATDGEQRFVCMVRDLRANNAITCTPGEGLNGEARDTLGLDCIVTAEDAVPSDNLDVRTVGAAVRAVQMAAAAQGALDLSIEYVRERQQFGRPLAKFQAIQQQLAVMAAEVTAATVCARRAFCQLDSAAPFFAVASAKSAVGTSASRSAAIAHQVHGAMGFTAEYGLHRHTRRLWTWREEFGNEAWWNQRLGQYVAKAGANRLWDLLIAEPV